MGTGYTRNDTPNNIADGNVINAADLDGEFDALVAAFNASTGHSHDGTSGEGPPITSSGLAANSVTATQVAANSVALGTKTTGSYVEQGATSGNGLSGSVNAESGTFTVTSNGTDANTVSTLVFRDGSGNFSAGTITADLTGDVTGDVTGNVSGTSGSTTGNAATATALATGRTIGMTGDVVWTSASFDGSGNVTGTATIQANSVALTTDTTGDYVQNITAGVGLASTGAATGEGTAHTLSVDLNELTTSVSDGDGDFFAVVDAGGNQKKLTKGNVNISGFNNDSGFITSANGGNAATLDSIDSSQFLRSDAADTKTSGDLSFSDNVKAKFGAGSDLEIYHDASDSYIVDGGTGNLRIQGQNLYLMNAAGTETKIRADDNSFVKLYFDNAEKLATTSYGIDISGSVVADTQTTTKSGSPAPNFDTYQNFVWTLTGNITLLNPTTEKTGQSGFFIFIHSGAARTVSLGTDYETAGGAGLTLSGAAGAVDIVPYVVQSSGNILLGAPQLAFS